MPVEAYPLHWPHGWPRTERRERANFGVRKSTSAGGYAYKHSLTVAEALKRLREQVRAFTRPGHPWRIPPDSVVISTNLRTRQDGLPYSSAREPDDPGVAVYFELDGDPHCLPCDQWDRVADNIAAIAKHLDAVRGIERWGVGDLRALFRGFQALPAPKGRDWRAVMGFGPDEPVSPTDVDARFRRLAAIHHPDRGGNVEQFQELQAAREAAREAVTCP